MEGGASWPLRDRSYETPGKVKRAWDSLWQEKDLYVLAVMRIVVGFSAFVYFLSFAPQVVFYFSGEGFLPLEQLGRLGPRPGPVSLLYLSENSLWVLVCYLALLITSLLYALGWRVVLTGPLLWLLVISFVNRNVYVFSGVALFIVQLLLVLMFADTGRVLSRGSAIRLEDGPASGPCAWVFYLIRLQLCIAYFKSGFYKLMGDHWLDGGALSLVLSNPDWRRFDYSWFLGQEWFCLMLSLVTRVVVFWELLFPVLILWRPTRYMALSLGLVIHFFHFLSIEVGMFVPLMLVCYLAFLPEDSVRKGLLRIRGFWLTSRSTRTQADASSLGK